MRYALLCLMLLVACPEPPVDPSLGPSGAQPGVTGERPATLPPLPADTPAPSVRASRQQVVDYLSELSAEERAALVDEAARVRALDSDEPEAAPIQVVELELPPLRPGLDDTDAPVVTSPAPTPQPGRDQPNKPTKSPEQPPRRAPPAPATDDGAVKPDLSDPKVYACVSPGDCDITCAMDCCGAPCGCTMAVNKAFKQAIERWGRRDCPTPRTCPAVGCIRQDAVGATCKEGRCRPVMSPSDF